MLLVTNRIVSASSGSLSILGSGVNEQLPFDILIFDVSRREGGWWLEKRASQTLDDAVCRDIRRQTMERGPQSTAPLYRAFDTAVEALKGLLPEDESETVYLFARCNDSPEGSFERGVAIEAQGSRNVVCFSCPIERRSSGLVVPRRERRRRVSARGGSSAN